MVEDSKVVLYKYFGFKEFLPLQEDIINSIIAGNNTLALLPTGGGKSLCYQVPALQKPGICVVISPLVALIKDQVSRLNDLDIKAIGITGSVKKQDLDDILDNAIYGNYKFLYMSPERLQQPLVKIRLEKMTINLIAVDEAHCISEWGHDFRPSYRHIADIKKIKPGIPIVALTATATATVQNDIITNLDISDAAIFKKSFKKDNVAYRIKETTDKRATTTTFYKKTSGSSIAYVRSRKNCVEYADLLEQNKISSQYYHGGLDHKLRDIAMKQWMSNTTRVMVATNAFGMGIDKPDVRSVVHLQLPDSIESYYQETGRAGRDNKFCIAQFIYNVNDLNHAYNQFVKALPTVDDVKKVYRSLCNFLQIAMHEGTGTTLEFSFAEFCNRYQFSGLSCYNCLQVLDRYDVIDLQQGAGRKSMVRFRESANKITQVIHNDKKASKVMQVIFRAYGSSMHQEINVNLNIIAVRSNVKEADVISVLQKLADKNLLETILQQADTQITFLVPRENDRTINKFAGLLKKQNNLKTSKLEAMMQLVQEKDSCLEQVILKYFGEKLVQPCGKCSNCKPKMGNHAHDPESQILRLTAVPTSFKSIQENLDIPTPSLVVILKRLLEQKMIHVTNDNKYIKNG